MNELTAAAIQRHLNTRVFGRSLIVEPQLPSTNTLARTLAADGAPEGTAVVAVEQTAGRGTRSRTFFSPRGGIYLSIVLRPHAADAGLITSCAAVVTARAIERLCPLDVRIKWVNDLYIGGRKLCGILTEAGLNPVTNALDYVVLGIGVNVAKTVFPPALASLATSLANEGYAVDRAVLIAAILEEWEHAYATIGSRDFLADSRRRSCVLGRMVTVSRGDDCFAALAEAITNDGHLVVCPANGKSLTLSSGEVSLQL